LATQSLAAESAGAVVRSNGRKGQFPRLNPCPASAGTAAAAANSTVNIRKQRDFAANRKGIWPGPSMTKKKFAEVRRSREGYRHSLEAPQVGWIGAQDTALSHPSARKHRPAHARQRRCEFRFAVTIISSHLQQVQAADDMIVTIWAARLPALHSRSPRPHDNSGSKLATFQGAASKPR